MFLILIKGILRFTYSLFMLCKGTLRCNLNNVPENISGTKFSDSDLSITEKLTD